VHPNFEGMPVKQKFPKNGASIKSSGHTSILYKIEVRQPTFSAK